jgi:SnoaL-like domain
MTGIDASQRTNLELLLDWITALRTGDLEALADLLDPHVVWHGLCGEFVCVGRSDVMAALREQVPVTLEIDAIELISAPRHVVMGTRSRDLPQPPGVRHDGQIYNVFEPRALRFVAIHDFARRDEALSLVGLDHQAQWH